MLKKVDISGDKAYQDKVKRLIQFSAKPRKALNDAKLIMFQDTQDHFKQEKGPGGSWPQLQPLTKFKRQAMGKWPGKMLQVSGRLKKLSMFSDKSFAAVGTNLKYAGVHQKGKGKIPKRQFLWLSQSAGQKILNAFVGGMDKA